MASRRADPAVAPDPADDGGLGGETTRRIPRPRPIPRTTETSSGETTGPGAMRRVRTRGAHAAATSFGHRGSARSKVARLKAELAERRADGCAEDEFEAGRRARPRRRGCDEASGGSARRAARAEVARLRARSVARRRDRAEGRGRGRVRASSKTSSRRKTRAATTRSATRRRRLQPRTAGGRRSKVARLRRAGGGGAGGTERADEAGATGEDVAELSEVRRWRRVAGRGQYEDEFETEKPRRWTIHPRVLIGNARPRAGLIGAVRAGRRGREDAFDAEDHF